MKNKSIIKIINEEISDFDFLSNDKYTKDQESINLIRNEDFQKQFICDSLLKRKEKIKTLDVVQSHFDSNWEKNGYLGLDYIVELAYTYDVTKQPAKFGIQFVGERISFSLDGRQTPGDYHTPGTDEEWFKNIKWQDIDVNMFMIGESDDDVEFLAFEHAPQRIQDLFVRDFIGNFIGEWASKGMGTPADYDNASKLGYC